MTTTQGTPTQGTTTPRRPAPADFDCGPLLLCLKDEQEVLERLLYTLRVQNLLLAAGEVRWMAASNSELEEAVKAISVISARREQLAAEANHAHGLTLGRLKDLAGSVADEWACQQLMQRQAVLRDLLDKVRRCSKDNQQMLAHGLAATTDALSILGRVPTYNASGSVSAPTPSISIDTRA